METELKHEDQKTKHTSEGEQMQKKLNEVTENRLCQYSPSQRTALAVPKAKTRFGLCGWRGGGGKSKDGGQQTTNTKIKHKTRHG